MIDLYKRSLIGDWLNRNIKYVFILPSVLFVIIMIIFPLAYNLMMSFHQWSMSNIVPPKFIGFRNYINLFKEERFLASIWRTLYFSAIGLIIQVILGVSFALFLHREFKGKNVTKTIFLLPMVTTPVAVGMVWMLIFEPTIGLANYLLSKLGIAPQVWLGDQKIALESLLIVDTWEWMPMIALIVMAGLSALPNEPYESAKIDGASSWQILWRITIPMISPTIIVAALLRLIDILKTFDIIYSTTQGGPGFATETINIYGYLQAFQYFNFGMASAVLVLFFIFLLILIALFIFLRKRLVVEY